MSTYFEGPREEVPPPPVVPLPLRLRAPLQLLYGAAVYMAIVPLAEVFPKLWPFEPATVAWRYSAFGIISTIVIAPTLGLIGVATLAGVLNHRRIQTWVSVGAAILGVVLLLLDLGFVADYLRVRGAAPLATRGAIDSAAWRAMFVAALTGAVFVVVGVVGIRSAATPPPGTLKKKGNRVGLVIARRPERVDESGHLRDREPAGPPR